jgi:23S rRNA pseudouridine2605 synthase
MGERLQKILSQWGVASRRQAEVLLSQGQVRVNGQVAHLGQSADPQVDRIEVQGQVLAPASRPDHQYILLHKPLGYISTCKDPEGRRTVLQLLPRNLVEGNGLHPVGRLDTDSSGALLLSNDGEFTFWLTHPSHQVSKTYDVWLDGHPSPQALQDWRQGLDLDGKRTQPAIVTVLKSGRDRTLLRIVIREGRNRQIRRVADLLGYPVQSLHRSAIGSIGLGTLPRGDHRPLAKAEVDALFDRTVVIDRTVVTERS